MSFTRLTVMISDKISFTMVKIGYIMAIPQYDRLEEDRQWMNNYGCIRIVSIHDQLDSGNKLFSETRPSDVLEITRQ